jgi:DNA-binding CsgD family transcriptional regulator
MANRWALGFLEISTQRYEQARATLLPLVDMARALGMIEPAIVPYQPDLIEALIRCGDIDGAEAHLREFEYRATVLDRPWPLGAAGRCRALLEAATGHAEVAIRTIETSHDAVQRCGQPLELTRTLIVAGEIYRRAKKRGSARSALKHALEISNRLGAPLWANQASCELARIPGRSHRSSVHQLTETERQVAALVASGRTNRETAIELFMSVHTVEANLRSIYRKLGVRSRTELAARRR